MFRKTMVLILAASISVFTALPSAASGTGLFSDFSRNDGADERLAVLDKTAEEVSVLQVSDGCRVEISQAYYEGNRIYISYRAEGCPMIQDGLELKDGSYADIIAGEETEQEDGSIIGWKECIIPEEETGDTQTFLLVYTPPENHDKRTLAVTLKQNVYDQYLQGVSTSGDYQAQAILYMGKIDLKGIVRITSPEQAATWIAWQNAGEGTGTDVIICWNLYQNGGPVSCDLFGETTVSNTEDIVFSVMFPFMDDLSGLTLVPEYSDAGEKPDEAIMLEPMDQK